MPNWSKPRIMDPEVSPLLSVHSYPDRTKHFAEISRVHILVGGNEFMGDELQQMRTSMTECLKTLFHSEGMPFHMPLNQSCQHCFGNSTQQAFQGMGTIHLGHKIFIADGLHLRFRKALEIVIDRPLKGKGLGKGAQIGRIGEGHHMGFVPGYKLGVLDSLFH